MKKYLAMWNIGYGDDWTVIEAESQEEADKEVYEFWREAVEGDADYSARELTPELIEEYCLEVSDEG